MSRCGEPVTALRIVKPRPVAILTALLVLGLGLGGCKTPDRTGSTRAATRVVADDPGAWPFWPTRMRLHPLTRLVADEAAGDLHIAARMELFDPEGHTTKGWGTAVFQLIGPGGTPIAQWELDLTDPDVNRERYDDVTRTYLVPLHLEADEALPDEPLLIAKFVSANGREFVEEIRVPTR